MVGTRNRREPDCAIASFEPVGDAAFHVDPARLKPLEHDGRIFLGDQSGRRRVGGEGGGEACSEVNRLGARATGWLMRLSFDCVLGRVI